MTEHSIEPKRSIDEIIDSIGRVTRSVQQAKTVLDWFKTYGYDGNVTVQVSLTAYATANADTVSSWLRDNSHVDDLAAKIQHDTLEAARYTIERYPVHLAALLAEMTTQLKESE